MQNVTKSGNGFLLVSLNVNSVNTSSPSRVLRLNWTEADANKQAQISTQLSGGSELWQT